MKNWYLISYDVRDDKRLRKVAKLMEGFGTRLQYSVFRCHLSERDVERLRWELGAIMEQEDALLVIGLCEACVKRIRLRDSRGVWPDDPTGCTIV
jgi:CRISPR-associated protein Cas2